MIGAVISAVLALVVIGAIAWVLWTFIIKDRLPTKIKKDLAGIDNPEIALDQIKDEAGKLEQNITTAANEAEHRLDTVTASIDRAADKVEARLDKSIERSDRMMDRMTAQSDRLMEMEMKSMRAGMAMQTATVEPYLEIAGKALDMAEKHPEATKIATTAAIGAATGGAGAVGPIMEAAAPAIAASAAGGAAGAAPAAERRINYLKEQFGKEADAVEWLNGFTKDKSKSLSEVEAKIMEGSLTGAPFDALFRELTFLNGQ
jgi:hypothetical protein